MKISVYNLEAKKTGDIELKDEIFNIAIKPEIVHQVFVSHASNQRQAIAHSKDKSEVRGGGRKPWKQKGTGRARHGSIRSPLWVGGGVTFGPRNDRNYQTKINKKVKRLALKMVLTDKVKENNFVVVENFEFKEPKTKLFVDFVSKLRRDNKKYLVLTAEKDEKIIRMTGNLPGIDAVRVMDANVYSLLNYGAVIVSKEAVEKLEKNLLDSSADKKEKSALTDKPADKKDVATDTKVNKAGKGKVKENK